MSCQYAAKKLAKHGSPSFRSSVQSLPHRQRLREDRIAALIEPEAEFQNGYGAMVHSVVTCKYDLNSQHVVDSQRRTDAASL